MSASLTRPVMDNPDDVGRWLGDVSRNLDGDGHLQLSKTIMSDVHVIAGRPRTAGDFSAGMDRLMRIAELHAQLAAAEFAREANIIATPH